VVAAEEKEMERRRYYYLFIAFNIFGWLHAKEEKDRDPLDDERRLRLRVGAVSILHSFSPLSFPPL